MLGTKSRHLCINPLPNNQIASQIMGTHVQGWVTSSGKMEMLTLSLVLSMTHKVMEAKWWPSVIG